MDNFFWIYKTTEKCFFIIFQPILICPDLMNPRSIEQNFSILLEFVKTKFHFTNVNE